MTSLPGHDMFAWSLPDHDILARQLALTKAELCELYFSNSFFAFFKIY